MGILEITQDVHADPATVHAAWLSADDLAAWWWPHIPDTRYDVDPRPGGRYQFISDAVGIGVRGRFLSVDPPDEISLTWTWLDDGTPTPEELVDVLFEQIDGVTRVTVTHHLDPIAGTPDDTRQGWEDVLRRLAQHVGS